MYLCATIGKTKDLAREVLESLRWVTHTAKWKSDMYLILPGKSYESSGLPLELYRSCIGVYRNGKKRTRKGLFLPIEQVTAFKLCA